MKVARENITTAMNMAASTVMAGAAAADVASAFLATANYAW
ncbi:hypothetical protein TUM20903_06050 [Citrobacter koseri]|nr:hypothetical protein TUM13189_05780 [Citrobacter koseri]BDG87867.1 hypothetical protein TUM20903_06050 [Citrobacter koseri]